MSTGAVMPRLGVRDERAAREALHGLQRQPRGAFTFTVRRRPDTGDLLLHVPYPGEGMPHMTLTEDHPGTYRIGS